MDDFVCNKLSEWGLKQFIKKFKDEEVDEDSFYCLEDESINKMIPKEGPKAKFKRNLKLLKELQNKIYQEEVGSAAQVLPSTSSTSGRGKRKLDPRSKSSKQQTPTKRRCDTMPGSNSKEILSDMEKIMERVKQELSKQGSKELTEFLRDKISDLKTDKRELVGVFGRTGAGKSSLINAVIGEDLLPSSEDIDACTRVMIKVEANTQDSYVADIEFITKEEWREELNAFLGDNAEPQKVDRDFAGKLSALYREGWKKQSVENLMDKKYLKEIFKSGRKSLPCKPGKELSEISSRYMRNPPRDGQGGEEQRSFWPLVKCVTVRVPNNDFLHHVTLVDLPGNGDRNKSRDEMWKEVVGSCSTVWIVTEINRAASVAEAWEILENASSLMGNGGECQQIHFICTKSDLFQNLDDDSAAGVRDRIHKRNNDAKETVKEEFSQQNMLQKHFSDDCLKVFTVSSKEFLKEKYLKKDETEIPKLQEFLQNLNDRHSVTLNYASGARGILSLIQGTHRREVADQKTRVYTNLEEKMKQEFDEVRKAMEKAYETFEKLLRKGVEKSKSSCEKDVDSVINPGGVSGCGFHRILRCIVKNNGTYKQTNLNMTLASQLTDSIDKDFRRTFPNDRKGGAFDGVIDEFSLDTKSLTDEYKDVELQLIFLKSEEEKMKTKLNKDIREEKKHIYNSLTKTIQETMTQCYKEAAGFEKKGSLENMRVTVMSHVRDSKDTMFEWAKDVMLNKLRDLKEEILKTLEKTMQEAIELSLKTDDHSLPDVSEDLDKISKYYDELIQVTGTDPAGRAAARP